MDKDAPRRVARRAARQVESSTVARRLARTGFVASGVMHALVGVLALAVAFGGEEDADQTGALRAVAAAPAGFIGLWLIATALFTLGVWHLVGGVLDRDREGGAVGSAKKWGRRAMVWGQAAVMVTLAVTAAAVAMGARPDAERTAEEASRSVLSIPGGAVVLLLVGLGIGVTGVAFVVSGVGRLFKNKLSMPDGSLGAVVTVLGMVGYVAKGIALVVVGVLLVVAAWQVDPNAAGGLDGAIDALLALPLGPWIVGLVGAGLIVYGAFLCVRARFARMSPE